jgi:hypothetical protein
MVPGQYQYSSIIFKKPAMHFQGIITDEVERTIYFTKKQKFN